AGADVGRLVRARQREFSEEAAQRRGRAPQRRLAIAEIAAERDGGAHGRLPAQRRGYSCQRAGSTPPTRATPPVRLPSRSSKPAAAWANSRWCSSDSPITTLSIVRCRACVIAFTFGRHVWTKAPSVRASSSRMALNAAASTFLVVLPTAGTGSAADALGSAAPSSPRALPSHSRCVASR